MWIRKTQLCGSKCKQNVKDILAYALLPHISGIPPTDVRIAERLLKHAHTGLYFENTMYTDSTIGLHIRYLAHKCRFYIQDFI